MISALGQSINYTTENDVPEVFNARKPLIKNWMKLIKRGTTAKYDYAYTTHSPYAICKDGSEGTVVASPLVGTTCSGSDIMFPAASGRSIILGEASDSNQEGQGPTDDPTTFYYYINQKLLSQVSDTLIGASGITIEGGGRGGTCYLQELELMLKERAAEVLLL
jgi:hypothetical protein